MMSFKSKQIDYFELENPTKEELENYIKDFNTFYKKKTNLERVDTIINASYTFEDEKHLITVLGFYGKIRLDLLRLESHIDRRNKFNIALSFKLKGGVPELNTNRITIGVKKEYIKNLKITKEVKERDDITSDKIIRYSKLNLVLSTNISDERIEIESMHYL